MIAAGITGGGAVVKEEMVRRTTNPLCLGYWGTRSSMLDWVRVAGLSCTKGVWYIYDWDTG